MQHPDWTRTAAIYQLNQRQLTPEGTFRAAQEHLERIRDLGASIVWLMPVHPIGEVNRKGTLGSPYAISDHRAVNPEFGTTEDLRAFVAAAHELGLKVILDWVANHTAWDHVLVEEHPEFYKRDRNGRFRPTPWWDWDDIIDLDYAVPGVHEYMADAMEHWVRECDVDGFRCDVAGFVPMDFWRAVRARLDAIKPVFMLAEWEERDLHDGAFDASYAWAWNETLHRVASGSAAPEALVVHYAQHQGSWPQDAMRMTFVSNHDHNHADGTEYDRFGDALPAAIVLSVVGEGIPLIYTGQELGNRKRLAFFDKDLVEEGDPHQAQLYGTLLGLKREHPSLWNAPWGAPMTRVPTSEPERVLAFTRDSGGDAGAGTDGADRSVLALVNLSPESATVVLGDGPQAGEYADLFTGETVRPDDGWSTDLPAWGFRVLRR
ncbi:alpha-amylase family glycosyl hydrolase [Nocardioides luti]|uniref:alpha-amylase family glycosyl hydrolase n=1 Tax=Nocardioides luti TaxID=2761101 RepID=UPI001C8AA13C